MYVFFNWFLKENLVLVRSIKTIESLHVELGAIRLIVAPWKFHVLKTSIFGLEASLLEQIILFVSRTSNFH